MDFVHVTGFTAVRDPYKDTRDVYRGDCEQLANAPRKQIYSDVRNDMRKLTPLEMVLFYNEAEKMLASPYYRGYTLVQRAFDIFGSGGFPSQLEQLATYLKERLKDESSSHYIEFSRRCRFFPSSVSIDEIYVEACHRDGGTYVSLELAVNNGVPKEFTLSHFSDPFWGYSFSQDPPQRLFPENSLQNKPLSIGSCDDSYDDEESDCLFPLVLERLAFQRFADRVKPYMHFDCENV